MKDNQKKTTQKVFIAFSVLLCVLMCAFFVAFVGFELRADASSTDLVFSQDETQNAGDLTRDDTQIYLSYTSGNDGNDGSSSSLAIQTLDRAIALLPNGGIVNVLDAVQISTSTNVSPTNQIVLRRTEQSLSVSNGELVSISGSNTTVRFDNIVFDGASIDSADVAKYLLTISATTSNVTFGDNVVIENNYTRGITVLSGSSTITTEDLTIRNCNETNGYGFYFDFAGNPVLELYFSGLNVLNNVSDGQGGAIYLTGGNSNLLEEVYVLNSYFSGNINTNNVNGNVTYSVMNFNIFADLTVSNCRFENNQGSGNGACINYSGRSTNANVQINGCEFLNNKVNRGCLYITNVNTFLLENCYFEGQLFSPSNGAPSYACASASNLFVYTIKDCTAINNRANAGVFQYNGGFDRQTEFNVEDCNFIDFIGKCIDIWEGGQTLSSLKVSRCNFVNGTMNQSSLNAISLTYPIEEVFFDDCQFSNFNSGMNDFGAEAYGACFYINTSISKFTMSDCVFNNNANIVSSPFTGANGGAMNILSSGEYNFINCKFLNNSTNFAGGAIYVDSTGSSNFILSFSGCEFGFNTAKTGGGAICISDPTDVAATFAGNVTFNDCYMHDNRNLTSNEGGAISAMNVGSVIINGGLYENNQAVSTNGGAGSFGIGVTIDGAIFRNNSAYSNGGALRVWQVVATNTLFYNNSTNGNTSSVGGAVFGGYGTFTNCKLNENSTSGNGGAVYVQNLTMTNCDVKKNKANEGAGIYAVNLVATNCNVSYNEAVVANAGIVVSNATATVIDGCKIIGNKAGERIGALMLGGASQDTQLIRNCEIRDNVAIGTTVRGTIYSTVYSLRFENVYITGNQAGTNQNIIHMSNDSTQSINFNLEIIGGEISGNSTIAGGIIYLQSSVQYPSQVRLENVDIYGNTDEDGAIVQVSENMVCNVINCSFYSNAGGEKGGAISVANNGSLVISEHISFGSNSATNGGAIYVMSGGEVALNNLNLNNIESTNGIIYTEQDSVFNISGGSVYNNSGENGGVFFINGSAIIQNLEAYGNSATNGGVLYVGETGVVTLDNINFYNNSATNGGAIYVAGLANFKDGVIDSNSATNGGGVYVGDGGSLSMAYDKIFENVIQLEADGEGENIATNAFQESHIYGEITNNSADFGGGVYIASGGAASIKGGHTRGQNEDENSVIQSAKVSNNKTNNHGGGIYVSAGGNLSINGGEVSNNIGLQTDIISQGFGIYNGGVTIINGGKISENNLEGETRVCYGGGIYSAENSTLSVANAFIYSNRASDGGAIYVGENSNVQVENTCFSTNQSFNTTNRIGMGALFAVNSGNLTVDNIIAYNHRDTVLIAVDSTGSLTMSNSNLYDNPITYYIYYYNTIENAENMTSQLNLYNCEFDFSSLRAGNNRTVVDFRAHELNIISCRFSSGDEDEANTTSRGLIIYAEIFSIRDSIFDGTRTQVQISGSDQTVGEIVGCSFINGTYEGSSGSFSPLGIINRNVNSQIEVSDCEFENNSSTTGASALYITNNANVYLSGQIVVQGNISENSTSAAVVIDSTNTIIRKGTLLLIDNNTGGNLVIESGNEGILEGDLEEGSIIGLKFNSPSVNSLAVGGVSSSYLMTNSILENFYSENSAWGLKFSSSQNGLIMYDSSPTDSVSVVAQDKVVVKEVGQSYGIVDGDIQVYFGGSLYQGDYTIEYSLTNDSETWVTESPSFSEKGSYTIYYRVTAGSDVVTGSVILNIISERLYISSLPQATLEYGENLGEATIINGLVEDERGQAVSGSWSFIESGVVPVEINSYYEVLFTPYSSNYENSNTLTANINVTIGYDIVFYVNNAFHTDINDINNSYTGLSKLEDMITYMNDGGSIIFTQTYTIDGTENIIANKDINFVRYLEFLTGPMILIESGENTLTLNGGSGTLVFEGAGVLSGTNGFSGVIIDNAGKLELGSNVIVRGFLITYEIGEDGIYSPIYNRESGVININGAEIYGNTIMTGQDSLGGVIYNLGEINISGGKFFLNNLNTSSGLVEKQGSGGFIYNLGRLTISGGEIFNNHAQYGGAIYIGNGGVAILSGGSITGNRASDAGGAIYVANGGRLVIGSCDISSNFAGNGMNGVEVEENSIVIDSSGNSLVGAGLDLIENLNPDEVIDNKNDIFNWLVPMLIIVAFVLFFTCVLMVKKRRKI